MPLHLALSLSLQMAFSYIQVLNENNIRGSVFFVGLEVDSRACALWERFCLLSCIHSWREMSVCLSLSDVLYCHRLTEIMAHVHELKRLKPCAEIAFPLTNGLILSQRKKF